MHTASMPPETHETSDIIQSPNSPPPPAVAPSQRTNNTLKLKERVNLHAWMDTPESRHLVAHESDVEAARQATLVLGFDVTAANITSTRKVLEISKAKPVKPEPQHDIDLVALQARVQQHHLQLDPIAGVSLADVLANLRDSIWSIEKRVQSLEASAD